VLHCTQRGTGDRKSVSQSPVRPSVKRVNCDKTNETSVQILTPKERSTHLVFRHKERLMGDNPFYLKFVAKLTPPPFKKRKIPVDIRS